MTKKTTLLSSLAVIVTATLPADTGIFDHCVELIKNSRTIAVTIEGQSGFSDTVATFCKEYQESRQQSRSANYGGSYELLSLSMGTSRTTEEGVASKYCGFDRTAHSASYNYRQYLEGIAPGAWGAYHACVNSREVTYRVLSPPTPTKFELVAQFKSDDSKATADLSWSSPSMPAVQCAWGDADSEGSRMTTLTANAKIRLVCTRDNPRSEPAAQPDHINVIRQRGGEGDIDIPWPKYNESGETISTLEEIGNTLDDLRSSVDELNESLNNLTSEHASTKGLADYLNDRLRHYLNRRWYNVIGNRKEHSCYKNNTDDPIDVVVTTGPTDPRAYNFCRAVLFVGSSVVGESADNDPGSAKACSIGATVPPGEVYRVIADGWKPGSVHTWMELRTASGSVDASSCP